MKGIIMESNYEKIKMPEIPERVHARANEISLRLCTISAAISELYALQSHYQRELDSLAKELSPGDAIASLLPVLKKGASKTMWDDEARTWDAGKQIPIVIPDIAP